MLIVLDFDLQSETSINFLDRFSQLFLLDEGLFSNNAQKNSDFSEFVDDEISVQKKFSRGVCQMARYLCRYTMRFSVFLDYKPS